MWLMIPGGFVSIVEKDEDVEDDTLTVRSRDRRSLVEFCRLAEISDESVKDETVTDYPYRLVATRDEVETAALAAIDEIRYNNFKNEAKRVRGGVFVTFLGRVWVEGLSLTPAKRARRVRSQWGDRD